MSGLEEFAAWARSPWRHWSLVPMSSGFILRVGGPGKHTSSPQMEFFGETPDQAGQRALTGLADEPTPERILLTDDIVEQAVEGYHAAPMGNVRRGIRAALLASGVFQEVSR